MKVHTSLLEVSTFSVHFCGNQLFLGGKNSNQSLFWDAEVQGIAFIPSLNSTQIVKVAFDSNNGYLSTNILLINKTLSFGQLVIYITYCLIMVFKIFFFLRKRYEISSCSNNSANPIYNATGYFLYSPSNSTGSLQFNIWFIIKICISFYDTQYI